MQKGHQKQKSIKLRLIGKSYGEIQKILGTPKSTLSYWLKDIPLCEKDKMRLYTKQVTLLNRGARSQRERRKHEVRKIFSEAAAEIKTPLSLETLRMMGTAMYWAEGTKAGEFQITNSDPRFISFFVYWLRKIFGIHPTHLKAKLNIYAQQDEAKIKKFWSQLTGIPENRFGKSYVKPQSKGFKQNNLYYGTIKVTVPRGSDMIYRINGWVNVALKNNDNKVKLMEQRWRQLSRVPRPAVNLIDM